MLTDLKEKRMPYDEPQGYVEQLVEKSTAVAIKAKRPAARKRWLMPAAAAAAVVLAAGVAAWNMMPSSTEVKTMSTESAYAPIDEFLDGLTDEEAAQITYYEIEEIPEL